MRVVHPTTPSGPADDQGVSQTPSTPARVSDLDLLAGRPLAEHIDVYQALHTELQAALAEIDDA